MTTNDSTANCADHKNTPYLYPVTTSSKPLHIAEDHDDHNDNTNPSPQTVNSEALQTYLR